ncbi:hypothetical protein HDU76_009711, partial [Blyttiomyces sp. JEL0837]
MSSKANDVNVDLAGHDQLEEGSKHAEESKVTRTTEVNVSTNADHTPSDADVIGPQSNTVHESPASQPNSQGTHIEPTREDDDDQPLPPPINLSLAAAAIISQSPSPTPSSKKHHHHHKHHHHKHHPKDDQPTSSNGEGSDSNNESMTEHKHSHRHHHHQNHNEESGVGITNLQAIETPRKEKENSIPMSNLKIKTIRPSLPEPVSPTDDNDDDLKTPRTPRTTRLRRASSAGTRSTKFLTLKSKLPPHVKTSVHVPRLLFFFSLFILPYGAGIVTLSTRDVFRAVGVRDIRIGSLTATQTYTFGFFDMCTAPTEGTSTPPDPHVPGNIPNQERCYSYKTICETVRYQEIYDPGPFVDKEFCGGK